MAQSFGQVIPVLGPLVGFPGKWSRTADTIIVARPVLSTTATNLPFGAGAVLIGSATGGSWQSFADYLATASNAQYLQQNFAGIATWNFKTMQPYSALAQVSSGITVSTTMTQLTVGSTTIVVASATGVAVGQSVEGLGIQLNTLVTGVSGTTITISLATTAVIAASTNVTFTTSTSNAVGYYPAGISGEVLVRSSIMATITNGTPSAGGPVYIRTVANASIGGTSVGDFEAAADSATTAITIGTTIGSTSVTTSAGTGLAVGQMVSSAYFPANTYIVSGATTSWVFSQAALATVASGGAMTTYNTALLGSITEPWLKFRTGLIDSNNVAEILISNRHVA